MQCPNLHELPEPPAGKAGWPWTEESRRLSPEASDGSQWPRIAVVTPSFNQGKFLEETIRSVLLQGYPNLEYLLLDGGSTDNSIEVIKKYSPWLSYWVSESDGGQSDAINRGLKRASGVLATWINSDDLLCKDALVQQTSQNGFSPNTVYVGKCFYVDVNGKIISSHRGRVYSLEDLLRISTIWRARGNIVQPEVLFPRELVLTVGGLSCDNHYTMDYELWGKLFLAGARFHYTDIAFGMFRRHPDQKTHNGSKITESLLNTAEKLVRLATSLPEGAKEEIVADLRAYRQHYQKRSWRRTGRLARIGLPPRVVNPIRKVRSKLQKDGP